ncbi:MAG TPA: serine/threonine-protein kinase [Gemmatimonadaceae bacterium]
MNDRELHERLQAALGDAYTLERELGGGGMSRVFLAIERALGRSVVVKVLSPHLTEGVSAERFTREVKLAARLQHPHIVPLLSAGEAAGLPWFTMPFVEGETLRARLARVGELPVAEALRTLREIASALAYAHGRGIVHRDIKPENVLLSEGTAMVSDFGVAKALSDAGEGTATAMTSLGVALGTPAYMAPEQGMADPRTDHRADIYAFGVLAYELLAGRTPFANRSPQAMLAAHVTEAPEPIDRLRPSTPPALAALVMQCLAKLPADRPQSAQDLVHAIDAITTPGAGTAPHVLTGMPAAAVTPVSPTSGGATAPGTAPSMPRARRPAALLGIAAGLLAVLLGGWFVSSRLGGADLADRRIAVAPFENLTGDSSVDVVGRMAADWLTQGIARAESVDVVSTMAVISALGDRPAGPEVVARLSQATGAGVVVSGTIYPQGDSLVLHARIADARTGRELRILDPAVAPRSDPMIAIETLRERLLGAFAVGSNRQTQWLRAPKYSAYREFIAGLEEFSRRSQSASRAYFERAIALDSTLVGAYFLLAISYSNAGMWDSSEAVTMRLARFRDQFTPAERSMSEWLEANLSGSEERQLAAAEQVLARDSTWNWSYLVGRHATAILRTERAVAALEWSDSGGVAAGWYPQVANLATAYHLAGRHADELAMLHRHRRDFPARLDLPARDLRAFGGLGDGAAALALSDTLLRATTNPNSTTITGAIVAAAMEFEAHHADTATARALAQKVVTWHQAHPSATPSRARSFQEGRAWLVLSELDSAVAHFGRATRSGDNIGDAGHLGVALALRGDTLRARAIADSLGGLQRKWLFGAHTFWQGVILGALGDRDAAVRLIQQAIASGQSKAGLHFGVTLRSLRGYPPFEALLVSQP